MKPQYARYSEGFLLIVLLLIPATVIPNGWKRKANLVGNKFVRFFCCRFFFLSHDQFPVEHCKDILIIVSLASISFTKVLWRCSRHHELVAQLD